MSQNLDPKDKIILDPGDSEAMTEHFSRLNPGDEVSGRFKATLDEAGQKVVVLSLIEIEIDKPDEDEPVTASDKDDEEEEGEEAPAITVTKNEEGVPDQEGNNPPDIIPIH